MAEVAEQEPQPGRHRAAGVVVSHHVRGLVHTRLPHGTLELFRCGQWVAARSLFARDVLQGDEHGAWYVAVQVFIATDPPLEIPAEVDHADIRVPEMFVQPGCVDERTEFHRTTRVSWQKWTSRGSIAWTFFSERLQSRRLACWPGHELRSAWSASR